MSEKKPYLLPAGPARTEIRVVNSRFIASAGPARTVEEARAFIEAARAEFADATHNVPGFVIGYPPSVITHCSDDGEPSGTAGRPVLAVLQGSGLGDVVVVITRYFGGTKLGTGGLVRAYTEATQEVLRVLPRAHRILTHSVMLAIPYSYLERVRLLAPAHQGLILDEDFGADVTLSLRFPIEALEGFQTALGELTRGSVLAEIIEANIETLMPVDQSD